MNSKYAIQGKSGLIGNVMTFSVAKTMIAEEGVLSLYAGLKEKLSLYFLVWFVYGMGFSAVGKLL